MTKENPKDDRERRRLEAIARNRKAQKARERVKRFNALIAKAERIRLEEIRNKEEKE
jgi:hypothetical protein